MLFSNFLAEITATVTAERCGEGNVSISEDFNFEFLGQYIGPWLFKLQKPISWLRDKKACICFEGRTLPKS
jgi:hypothetical protein